jgi:cytidylate kinase
VVITIDGPSGVGKSTVSKAVAVVLDLAYLDTGSTYRAATLAVLRDGADATDESTILRIITSHEIDYHAEGIHLDGVSVAAEVRDQQVTANVSAVSAHPKVRAEIVAIQRRWVERHGNAAVVEGRDIGTVVFPDTPFKFFLTARPEVRARRRAGDSEVGEATIDEITSNLAARDKADSTRAASPLRPADDATVIDTSEVDVERVVATIIEHVHGEDRLL